MHAQTKNNGANLWKNRVANQNFSFDFRLIIFRKDIYIHYPSCTIQEFKLEYFQN